MREVKKTTVTNLAKFREVNTPASSSRSYSLGTRQQFMTSKKINYTLALMGNNDQGGEWIAWNIRGWNGCSMYGTSAETYICRICLGCTAKKTYLNDYLNSWRNYVIAVMYTRPDKFGTSKYKSRDRSTFLPRCMSLTRSSNQGGVSVRAVTLPVKLLSQPAAQQLLGAWKRCAYANEILLHQRLVENPCRISRHQ